METSWKLHFFFIKIFYWRKIRFLNIYPGEVACRWCPDASICLGPVTDDLGVNSAGYTVVQLGVQFGELVGVIHAGVVNVTNSGSFDDVTNNEFFDSLVLGNAASTVCATYRIYVTAAMFGASSVPAFTRLEFARKKNGVKIFGGAKRKLKF